MAHPDISQRIARTEAQGLANMSLGFLGATNKNLSDSDKVMGAGEISIQRQRIRAFGDALRSALEIIRSHIFLLGAALARLGRPDEARYAVKAGLALNPAFAISRALAAWTAMSDDPTYLAQLEPICEGLRKAGGPEQ